MQKSIKLSFSYLMSAFARKAFVRILKSERQVKSFEWIKEQMVWTMFRNKWRGFWRKISIIGLGTFIVLYVLPWNAIILYWNSEFRENLNCFHLEGNLLPEFDENDPELGSGIYFHETSCPKDLSDISLNARQSCSVESALRAHPNTDVFLLISSPIFTSLENTNNKLVKQLLSYPNFKLRHIDFSRYLLKTPLKIIQSSGALNFSDWPVAHCSDVLRYTTLYKFGGIYLDLDVIILKPLTGLKNFAGAESNVSIGSGILGFGYDNVGREIALDCAEELASTYNGKIWGFNGPGVITRVLEKKCKTNVISKMFESNCGGFQVYPTEYFSALSFRDPQLFFQEGNTDKVREIFNRSYAIHFWNKISSKYILDRTLDIPFLKYAHTYCPKVYKAAGGCF